ncbi:glycosyltransferase [Alkalimonas sp. MEB108]|uniref:Glycosyltransferase n=1 Tax=Alkalimonas cellulosilytica TaxID=3058395 RepID=A0ABU7J9I8_9GAMM|nr:glycosyltransferase [Alkalimonas sp. MEB108]MEE2002880.1 glycosyltransferase [Alkalimonas sp. MEB108]
MATTQQTVNVLCIKWGKKYGPDYVNKLHAMVQRNLTLPHRFVCLTDDAEGIDAHIEVKEIPMVGFKDFDERQPWSFGHGWLKVTSFADPLYDLTGPTLFIDLDVVIVDNIDSFFEPEGEFFVIKEWDKSDATGNTSVYRYTIGAHSDLIELLKNHKDRELAKVRNEQEFVTQNLAAQGKLQYWPEGWCVSFKRHCLPKGIMSWFKPATIPAGAKIVAFHGKPNPPDAIAGISGKWYRRVLPVQWVKEMWG